MRKTFALGGNSPAKLDASTGLPEKPAQLGLALRALSNATARDAWRAWVEASLIYWRFTGGGGAPASPKKSQRRARKAEGLAEKRKKRGRPRLPSSRRAPPGLPRAR